MWLGQALSCAFIIVRSRFVFAFCILTHHDITHESCLRREATGCFENLRTKNSLTTVSNDDNSFECHVRLDQVRSAQFATKDSGDRTLHIVRLKGEDGTALLSAILKPDTGEEEGAIQFFEKLRERFGDEPALVAGA